MKPNQNRSRNAVVPGVLLLASAAGTAAARPDLFVNGPYITASGGGAGGANLSAVATTLGNITYGYSCQQSPDNDRVADNFTLGAAATITSVVIYAFQTDASVTSPPITSVNLRIWNGRPQDAGSQVIFGDMTTNRLMSATWSGCYRAWDTQTGNTQRPIFAVEASVNPPLALAAGTYWLDVQSSGVLSSGPSVVFVTQPGQMGAPGANARYKAGGSANWINIRDSSSNVQQDLAFVVRGNAGGGPAPCYANCDGSTATPRLTGNDFTCFVNSYAINGTYANCDQSTGTPLLTANDFTCFVNRYATGCT